MGQYSEKKISKISSSIFPYLDDTCLAYQHKDLKRMKEGLTESIFNIYDWFVDPKFCIHFVEGKKLKPFRYQG